MGWPFQCSVQDCGLQCTHACFVCSVHGPCYIPGVRLMPGPKEQLLRHEAAETQPLNAVINTVITVSPSAFPVQTTSCSSSLA
jgi:hypothetical protein